MDLCFTWQNSTIALAFIGFKKMGFLDSSVLWVKPQKRLIWQTMEHNFLPHSRALNLCPFPSISILCLSLTHNTLFLHMHWILISHSFHLFPSLHTPFDFELSLTGFLQHLSILHTECTSFLCALLTNPPCSSHQCQPGAWLSLVLLLVLTVWEKSGSNFL